MRSTRATAAVERLKVRTTNTDYSMVLRADALFQLVLASEAGQLEKIGTPLPMDEFVAYVNAYGPQTPRRMTKSDIAFEKQLVNRKTKP
jgi:hypothetical protein